MNILLKPNNKKSKTVERLTADLERDIDMMEDMMETNKFENGRSGEAVTHCQMSEDPYQIFVAKVGSMPNTVIINPEIIDGSDLCTSNEGCLSFPYKEIIPVERLNKIKVKYQDRYMNEQVREFEGVQAAVFQHEIQHFNGDNIYNKNVK